MRLEEGQVLGDWLLLKQLGEGLLGHTFFAEHRFTKKKGALKILPEDLSADQSFVSRFEQEVLHAASIDHEGIAKTLNASCVDGLYFLATECTVNENQQIMSLSEFLAGRRATQQEALKVAEQVAEALDYVHGLGSEERRLAHGNLKPSNLMISEETPAGPLVQMADFGLFRMIGCENVLLRSYKEAFDLAGSGRSDLLASLAQNLYFLSPEQRKGDWSDPVAADIWAFGILLFWMLSGSYPEGTWESEMRFSGGVADWDHIIRNCLSLEVSKRPALLSPLFHRSRAEAQRPASIEPTAPQKLTNIYTQNISIADPDRQIKEYAPEKRDLKGVVPLLTEAILVREGPYSRGSNQGCRDEIPRHSIRVKSFSIDIHPVTNEQFVRFLDSLGDEKDQQNHDIIRLKDSRIKRNAGRFTIERGYGRHPVVGVTWYGAVGYCAWVGKRLPTEAEWEVACCGGLEHPTYPTGEDIEKTQANFFSADTTAVMSYPPNGYGIYDMAGNVYEWCSDWYEYNYYEYSANEPDFPKGPVQGVYRVLRGGCWKSLKEDMRCSKRHRNNPGAANGTYGFRCAQDA